MKELPNKQYVDSRIFPFLQQMFDDMRAQGMSPIAASGYRSNEKQKLIMKQTMDTIVAEGLSPSEAKAKALKWVSEAGHSEHQTGLAVDINADGENKKEDAKLIYTWLAEHAWKYGFILRYPQDKSEITRISYEPWHYRYVGVEAAAIMFEKKLCLEEFLDRHTEQYT